MIMCDIYIKNIKMWWILIININKLYNISSLIYFNTIFSIYLCYLQINIKYIINKFTLKKSIRDII